MITFRAIPPEIKSKQEGSSEPKQLSRLEQFKLLAESSDREIHQQASKDAYDQFQSSSSRKVERGVGSIIRPADVLITAATAGGSMSDKLGAGLSRTFDWVVLDVVSKAYNKVANKVIGTERAQQFQENHPGLFTAASIGGIFGVVMGSQALSRIALPKLGEKLFKALKPETQEKIGQSLVKTSENINTSKLGTALNKGLDKVGKVVGHPVALGVMVGGLGFILLKNFADRFKAANTYSKQSEYYKGVRDAAKQFTTEV